ANGHVIEYAGDAIRSMSMEERMTVCNMSIECGGRSGLISPDETTFEYLKGKPGVPRGDDFERAVAKWKALATDAHAAFDREVAIDVHALSPMVTWGTNPAQAIGIGEKIPKLSSLKDDERVSAQKALEYVGLKEDSPIEGTPIEWAFLGSCTNGRIQ